LQEDFDVDSFKDNFDGIKSEIEDIAQFDDGATVADIAKVEEVYKSLDEMDESLEAWVKLNHDEIMDDPNAYAQVDKLFNLIKDERAENYEIYLELLEGGDGGGGSEIITNIADFEPNIDGVADTWREFQGVGIDKYIEHLNATGHEDLAKQILDNVFDGDLSNDQVGEIREMKAVVETYVSQLYDWSVPCNPVLAMSPEDATEKMDEFMENYLKYKFDPSGNPLPSGDASIINSVEADVNSASEGVMKGTGCSKYGPWLAHTRGEYVQTEEIVIDPNDDVIIDPDNPDWDDPRGDLPWWAPVDGGGDVEKGMKAWPWLVGAGALAAAGAGVLEYLQMLRIFLLSLKMIFQIKLIKKDNKLNMIDFKR